jgi:hypothetical protein
LLVAISLSTLPCRIALAADVCIDAHGKAQELREQGKLKAAREALSECAKTECADLIVKDCTRWLDEISREVPSIVVRATRDGKDVDDVALSVDGKEVAPRLDGKALELDPGPHEIRLALPDGTESKKDIVVKLGVTGQIVELELPGAPRTEPKSVEPAPVASAPSPLVWVAAGVGVLGLASFGYFGLKAKTRYDELDSACSPNCDSADSDAVKRDFLIADISLAVGVLGIGTAAYLHFSSGPSSRPKTSGVALSATPLPRGGFIGVFGSY